jgi:preprotein translocase subunit SecB
MSGTAENKGAEQQAAALHSLVQYTKDFSFENPNAPQSLQAQQKAPEIGINVNVGARQVSETEFEVDLLLEGNAKIDDTVLFAFDLTYSGIFRVTNLPEEQVHPVVMIECPRLLFPFARQIVGEAVRNGGFPPLYIDPIDFTALYRQRLLEMQTQQQQGAAANS